MWESFKEYMVLQCRKNPTNVAEIGVGKFNAVYDFLESFDHINIIKTDIMPNDKDVIEDDIVNPNLELYKNMDIIYSIRPPSELQPHLVNLALKINSQLIIKPLTNEDLNTGKIKMKLKNFKKTSFYTLK